MLKRILLALTIAIAGIPVQAQTSNPATRPWVTANFCALTGCTLTGTLTVAPSAANSSAIVLTGGTITALAPLLDMTRTWNNAAVDFTAIKLNVTNTASGSGALLLDLQVGGSSKFNINKSGTIAAPGGGNIGGVGLGFVTGNYASVASNGGYAFSSGSFGSNDTWWTRVTAASIRQGDFDAASPVAQTLGVQGGSGTNIAAAATWTFVGPLGTGTGNNGDIVFQTGVKTGSGTGAPTKTTALTIKGETQTVIVASGKNFQLGNAAVTGLTAGALAALTNASIVIYDSTGTAYRVPAISP